MVDYLPFFLFYGCAGAFIYLWFFAATKDFWRSLTSAVLIVFVSSEFWEIPIFFFAYLGLIGTFPEWTNHLIVCVMAVLLFILNKPKIDKTAGALLFGDLVLNFVFLIVFPGVLSGWILRAISLTTLTAVILRHKN